MSRLEGASAGERWVIRYRLPGGSATDVVGWLEDLGPESVRIAGRDGRLHRIDRSAIIAARKAPAAAGGGDPHRVSAAELERIALPGWLALHESLGEWTLRAAGGFTGPANSCLALGDPGMTIQEAAARIVAHAAGHGIPPMAQVITGSAEDAALRGIGWHDAHVPTDVLAARLNDLLSDEPADAAVQVTEVLTDGWLAAYRQTRPNTEDPALLRMILDGNPPRAFAGVMETQPEETRKSPGVPVTAPRAGTPSSIPFAIARGHLSRDWLGVAAVWIRPDRRQGGWAPAMLRALGHWAARRGARYCYLQVASENAAAIAAYERLGFARHHGYHYLSPAGVPGSSPA